MTFLFSFSGIDGAGKSTQIERVRDKLKCSNRRVIYLWTRGGNTPGVTLLKSLARKISPVQLPPPGRSDERTKILKRPTIQILWLVAAMLELYWIYGVFVRWHIFQGRIVLCDRYITDTLIDFKVMFPNHMIESWRLWRGLVAITPKPSASFLLRIPLETSLERCKRKYEPFPDTDEERLVRFHLYASHFSEDQTTIIDGSRSADSISESILRIIDGS